MSLYCAILNGKVVNILEASEKKIAEEASKLECVDYDLFFNPKIGDSYSNGNFTTPIVEEKIEEITND
jgi:hypothetical protein